MNSFSPPRGGRPKHGESVIDRYFRLLRAFSPEHKTLSLGELSVRAGLPKSTASRLSQKLVELGALERSDEGGFVVGLRLLEIASLAPRGHGLRTSALPYLEDLHHATGQHVLLAVRDGLEAVLIERLSAKVAGSVMYRVGGRLPLDSTGVGLVLLAHESGSFQDNMLGRDLIREPEGERIDPRALRAQLAAVRRDGFAVVSRPHPGPMTSVAAPIRDPHSRVLAALSVVAPTGSIDPASLKPAVIAVARAISRVTKSDLLESST